MKRYKVQGKPPAKKNKARFKTKYICPECGCDDGDMIDRLRSDFWYCRRCGAEFDTDMIQEGM